MRQINTSIIIWAVACVNEFARSHGLSPKAAFQYLFTYGGIDFLTEHYEAEHTLSLDDTIEDLGFVCRSKGGHL